MQMTDNRFLIIVLMFIALFSEIGTAQVSQGGTPLKTAVLKSTKNRVVEMPPIQDLLSRETELKMGETDKLLKPFEFAYPFRS